MRRYIASLVAALCGCSSSTTEAIGQCPEVDGFASYAYFCSGDAIYECHADGGALSMCDQAASTRLTCVCDTLTSCKTGSESVACAKR